MIRVKVYNNDIKTALRKLKKNIEKEGMLREMKKHEYYEPPSEQRRRERSRKKKAASKNNTNQTQQY